MYIFFYGSLIKGMGGQEYLKISPNIKYINTTTVDGLLYDLGEYPGLVKGKGKVKGDIYLLNDASIIEKLDWFEDYNAADIENSLYAREKIYLLNKQVYIYYYNKSVEDQLLIEGGDWVKHCAMKKKKPRF